MVLVKNVCGCLPPRTAKITGRSDGLETSKEEDLDNEWAPTLSPFALPRFSRSLCLLRGQTSRNTTIPVLLTILIDDRGPKQTRLESSIVWRTCGRLLRRANTRQPDHEANFAPMMEVENENPVVYAAAKLKLHGDDASQPDFDVRDERETFTTQEVFAHIRHLNDPEHPLTLEQLHVVCLEHIYVDDTKSTVRVLFTPTIPHCSMATLIGLCIRVKLLRSMPSRFKISVQIYPGAHQSEVAVNKQLADKERVAAALENGHLLDVVTKCIEDTDR